MEGGRLDTEKKARQSQWVLELCDCKPRNANKSLGPGRAWNGSLLWESLEGGVQSRWHPDVGSAALMADFLSPHSSLTERCGHLVQVCNPSCSGGGGSKTTNSGDTWRLHLSNNNKTPNFRAGDIIQHRVLAWSAQGPRLESPQSIPSA